MDGQVVPLENGGRYLGNINSDTVNLLDDGSLLFTSRYKIYKFGPDGKLQLEFGGRGDGPGEFVRATSTVATDKYFIVLDTSRVMLNFFTLQGEYITRHSAPYRQIVSMDNKIYATTFKEIMLDRTNPRAVVKLQPNQEGDYIPSGDPFHPYSKECRDLMYNFKLLFMAYNQGEILLIDEVFPQLFIYDASDLREITSVPLHLKGYVKVPDRPVRFENDLDYAKWLHSGSLINFLDYSNGMYLVSHSLPIASDEDPMSKPDSMLSFFNRSGEPVREPMRYQDFFIGVQDNKLHFIEERMADEGPIKYYLRKVALD